jgi:Rrf2 family protein
MAVLELALRRDGRTPVRVRDLAEPHGLPTPFLVQILHQLRVAGLVRSVRGAGGGYRLERDPSELTVGEVVNVIDGTSEDSEGDPRGLSRTGRTMQTVWRRLAAAEQHVLASFTFADLAEQASEPAEPMYYI